jgi:hypothetical protein
MCRSEVKETEIAGLCATSRTTEREPEGALGREAG